MLYGRAVKMLELADITARELKDYRDGTAGVLRLGVVSSVGSTYLIHAVQDFQKQYPHIDFELTEGNTYQLLEQLSSGLIELALVRTPFSKQGLTSVPLIEEPLLAVGSKRYFQNKNPITLSDLSGLPLILYRRWEPILLESFREAGLVPHVFCKNDDARTSVIWADAGLGISILPASAFGLVKNPDTVSRQISDLPLTSSICLVRTRDTWISTAPLPFKLSLGNLRAPVYLKQRKELMPLAAIQTNLLEKLNEALKAVLPIMGIRTYFKFYHRAPSLRYSSAVSLWRNPADSRHDVL